MVSRSTTCAYANAWRSKVLTPMLIHGAFYISRANVKCGAAVILRANAKSWCKGNSQRVCIGNILHCCIPCQRYCVSNRHLSLLLISVLQDWWNTEEGDSSKEHWRAVWLKAVFYFASLLHWHLHLPAWWNFGLRPLRADIPSVVYHLNGLLVLQMDGILNRD